MIAKIDSPVAVQDAPEAQTAEASTVDRKAALQRLVQHLKAPADADAAKALQARTNGAGE